MSMSGKLRIIMRPVASHLLPASGGNSLPVLLFAPRGEMLEVNCALLAESVVTIIGKLKTIRIHVSYHLILPIKSTNQRLLFIFQQTEFGDNYIYICMQI